MNEKTKIAVIMSSYNGEQCIERQLNSIFSQKNVDVLVFVRDDGSVDGTINILEKYKKNYKNFFFEKGNNVGWQQSFMLALENAPEADFYAFSDQDDFWFDDKLSVAVSLLKLRNCDKPILFHCNKLTTDENLAPLPKQVQRLSKPLNRKNALVQEYVQGCSVVMNRKAKELVLRNRPKATIPHDFWCALICYLFGEIIYNNDPYFYHISYGTNASGEGHLWRSRWSRFKRFFSNEPLYHLPIRELIEGYDDLLLESDKKFINQVKNYKKSFFIKLKLLGSFEFRRKSFIGTLSLKISILLNKL